MSGFHGAQPALAAGGILMTSVGAKEKGMGGAGLALPQDAVAPINNPASTVEVGDQVSFGGTVVLSQPAMNVEGTGAGPFPLAEGKWDAAERYFTVPYLSATKRIDDRWSAGFSAYGLFGLGVSYPAEARPGCPAGLPGTGPLCAGKTTLDTSALFISPTIAYRITPRTSVGLSPSLVYGQFRARGFAALAAFGASSDPAHVTDLRSDESLGFAAKIGLHHQGESFSFGLTYQTEADMRPYGKYRGLLPEGANLDLPAVLAGGIAWRVAQGLDLVADAKYVLYSGVPAFSNRFVVPLGGGPQLGTDEAAGFGWNDQLMLHFGAQQRLGDGIAVRAGYSYTDRLSPASEGLLNALAPATFRHGFSGGFSVDLAQALTLDAAIVWSPPVAADGRNGLSPGQTVSMTNAATEFAFGLSYAW
ncbi:OmpP1/FadL family transporter [Zavarzinia aquatilis]|nr:outer membrane protein transport protein [Zavarzinia aquatilis]